MLTGQSKGHVDQTGALKVQLNIVDEKFTTAVFDKRNGFNVVNFPYMDSNIPSKPAYGISIRKHVEGGICLPLW